MKNLKQLMYMLVFALCISSVSMADKGGNGGDPRAEEFLQIADNICLWFKGYGWSQFANGPELFDTCFEKAYMLRQSLNNGPVALLEFPDRRLFDKAGVEKPSTYSDDLTSVKVNAKFWHDAVLREKYVQVGTEMAGLMSMKNRYDVGDWAGNLSVRTQIGTNNYDSRGDLEKRLYESSRDYRPLDVQFHELYKNRISEAKKLVGDWRPSESCRVSELLRVPVVYRISLESDGSPIVNVCEAEHYKSHNGSCLNVGYAKAPYSIEEEGDNTGRPGSVGTLKMTAFFIGEYHFQNNVASTVRFGDLPSNQELIRRNPKLQEYENNIISTKVDVVPQAHPLNSEGKRTISLNNDCDGYLYEAKSHR